MAVLALRNHIFLIAIIVLSGACTSDNSKNSITVKTNSITKDTLYTLLNKSTGSDLFEYQPNQYLYLKTGNLFLKDKKNAVLVYLSSKGNDYGYYTLQLFSLKENKWIKEDEVDSIECFPIQFNISYEDYNFDGCKDILVEKSCSNGLSEMHQNLLTVDSNAMKLTNHTEFSELANTSVDLQNKCIRSQKVISCQPAGNKVYCDLISRWKYDKLITLKNNCPCAEEDSLVSK